MDSGRELLATLLRALVPRETDLVTILQAYFDESDSHDGAPALTVAGFVFGPEECLKLDEKWLAVLDRYGLPYFHMVDCAHGNPPFDKLTKDECIAVEKEMIAIIRGHLMFGMAVSVSERDYYDVFGPSGYMNFGSAYSYCCHTCVGVVGHFFRDARADVEIAYFFEAGHKSQGETNKVMETLFNDPNLRRTSRYAGHSFASKTKLRPLQAADLFAWLASNQTKRVLRTGDNNAMRADLAALVANNFPIVSRIQTRPNFLEMQRSLTGPSITGNFGGLSFRTPLR